ncbi:hypothetical protein ACHAWF_005027 [Thalassiosira exigua]
MMASKPTYLAAMAAVGTVALVAAAFVSAPIASANSHRPCFANHNTPRGHLPYLSHRAARRTRNRSPTSAHLYRKFHDYAWDKLLTGGGADLDTVPEELKSNASPAKGAPEGTNVVVSIRSISQFPCLPAEVQGADGEVLWLARSAFLETQTPTNEALITPMTIHVLNLVLFPSPHIRDAKSKDNEGYLGLPIFGADIVSLPGNKHLVALDFQPVLPLGGGAGSEEAKALFPQRYSHLEGKLKSIHSKYQMSESGSDPLLPWGGDIPPQAERFFSPYALWTRLGDDNAMDTVRKVVWEAYREYADLYMDLMVAVQNDLNDGKLEMHSETEKNNPVSRGQVEYLEYRRANDPARPMLQRLYGIDWSERVIGDVLFPDL